VSQADEQEPLPLPPEQEAELLEALEAALRPAELDPTVQERLIEMALEDPLAPPSEEELVESARLRDALEQGGPHEDQALLTALRSAAEPHTDQAAVESAVKGALQQRRRGNVIYAVFGGASAVLAAAAVLMLFLGTAAKEAPAPAADYARPRSTTPLFSERFETEGTTARMDLIASERSRDLRDNRYASWGVR
jgi:hypothetical protein